MSECPERFLIFCYKYLLLHFRHPHWIQYSDLDHPCAESCGDGGKQIRAQRVLGGSL